MLKLLILLILLQCPVYADDTSKAIKAQTRQQRIQNNRQNVIQRRQIRQTRSRLYRESVRSKRLDRRY